MTKTLQSMASSQTSWLKDQSFDNNIIICSSLRLSRNLKDIPFPGNASPEQRLMALEKIFTKAEQLLDAENILAFELDGLRENERVLLAERNFFSLSKLFNQECGIIVDEDESFSIFVNNEDHLAFQTLNNDFDLYKSWQQISKIDDLFTAELDYAFHNDYGYLTSNPGNVGTGLKTSAYLDLCGLALTEQLEKVAHSAEVLGFAVRGEDGAERDFTTPRLFISNRRTLGVNEEGIIENFTSFIRDLEEQELKARQKLLADHPHRIIDHISRSYGLLKYCHLIDEDDARNCILTLRTGVSLGMFEHLSKEKLEEAYTFSKDAHLEFQSGERSLPPHEINKMRADFLKKFLLG